jgi:N-acetylmuramoyl-L-alanine amidase
MEKILQTIVRILHFIKYVILRRHDKVDDLEGETGPEEYTTLTEENYTAISSDFDDETGPETVEEIYKEEKEIMNLEIRDNFLTRGGRNRRGDSLRDFRALVVHWVAGPGHTPNGVRNWFERGEVYGSTQYMVGIDGEIVRFMPEDEVAWHIGTTQPCPRSNRRYTDFARTLFGDQIANAGTPNFHSIGIEMGHRDMTGVFTSETINSTARLCADILSRRNKTIGILTNHMEVTGWKNCPKFFTDNPDEFVSFKRRVNEIMPVALRVPNDQIKIEYMPVDRIRG